MIFYELFLKYSVTIAEKIISKYENFPLVRDCLIGNLLACLQALYQYHPLTRLLQNGTHENE